MEKPVGFMHSMNTADLNSIQKARRRTSKQPCVWICRLNAVNMDAVQTYLVDAFLTHAANVVAACTVLRSLLGALVPLCGLQMYEKLGLGWGNSLLAFLALAMAPIPILF